jgi:uncharacterized protein YcbK (DUF882 family)
MMRFKEGIKLAGIRAEIVMALTITADVFRDVANAELIVTEITGGTHGRGSLHYVGQAADIRSRNLTKSQQTNVVLEMRERLGENYDVILESTHIHLEFQPK